MLTLYVIVACCAATLFGWILLKDVRVFYLKERRRYARVPRSQWSDLPISPATRTPPAVGCSPVPITEISRAPLGPRDSKMLQNKKKSPNLGSSLVYTPPRG